MEWFVGLILAFFFLALGFLILSVFIDDEDRCLGYTTISALVFYAFFVLAFEMGTQNLLVIQNSRVVETKRSFVFAWDVPEYITGVQTMKPAIWENGFKKEITVYFRTKDEEIESMQKYYEKITLPDKSLSDVENNISKELQMILRDTKIDSVKDAVTTILSTYGFKVIGFE